VTAAAIAIGEVKRALLRLPNWLGDTVMAVPTLRALRAAMPGAELWCLGPWVEPLLAVEPGITHRLATPRRLGARLGQARRLRRARFDLAVLLPGSFEAALAGRLSGARWRVGYGTGRSPFLTHAVPTPPGWTHQVAAYLALLGPLGIAAPATAPTLSVDPGRRAEAQRLLEGSGVPPGAPRVGLQLGAALGPAKLWPSRRIAELATRLQRRGIQAVLLGSPDARDLAAAAQAATASPIPSLVGRDHPGLLPALIGELDALVGADSGPAHVAAAVGVPAITLFGPTDPRLTTPLGPDQRALWRQPACAPCFLRACPIDHRCMEAIEVEPVEAAVVEALGRRR
jgi:heptosyltransferase-2